MEDAKEKGHEGAAAASSAAGLDSSAAGVSRLAAAEEPIATGDAGSGCAGRTGSLASAPHVDAGAVYDQEQMSNVSDAGIHVVVTPNEVQ